MDADFQALIDKLRARMAVLREAFERDGYLFAVSAPTPGYSIWLTKNTSTDAPYRVASFDGREPAVHREYDLLEGRVPPKMASPHPRALISSLRLDHAGAFSPALTNSDDRTRQAHSHGSAIDCGISPELIAADVHAFAKYAASQTVFLL
jgi:hypothetical protein